jgi:hypothetical protein
MTLFDTFTAAARNGDPQTSHEAARSVKNTAAVRAAILRLLEEVGPCTDEDIAYYYDTQSGGMGWPMASPSGLRTRRSELVEDGQVVDSGERRRLASGRNATVWALAR